MSSEDRDESAVRRADATSAAREEPLYDRHWGRVLAFVAAVITLISVAAYQLIPSVGQWLELLRTHSLTEEDKVALTDWARKSAGDGVTSTKELEDLAEMVSSARMREEEVRAYVATVEEAIAESHDLVSRGAAAASQGGFSRAANFFDRATRLDPDNVQAWVNLGAARLELGLPEEAQSALLEALKRDRKRWTAYYNLGAAFAASGDRAQAFEHLEHSLELAAENGLSAAEKQSLRRDLAENRWLETLRGEPEFNSLREHRALAAFGEET